MLKYRLIAACISAILFCFAYFPLQTIIISATLIVSYVLFTKLTTKNLIDTNRSMRRKEALRHADMYLGRYTDIWRNLTLSNEYCTLSLAGDGFNIYGREKQLNGIGSRSFKVVNSEVHEHEELWNLFCKSFSSNTNYDDLLKKCRLFRAIVEENFTEAAAKPVMNTDLKPDSEIKKVDINNCSEQELSDLPGVSVIMAKKAVKKRDEIGGFKTADDFFEFLNLKQHMRDNLKDSILVTEMKNKKIIERYDERNVDL